MDAPRIIRHLPIGNFELISHVTISNSFTNSGFQGAGLLLYFNMQNYAWVVLSSSGLISTAYTLQGIRKGFFKQDPSYFDSSVYLAFKADGLQTSVGYSRDGNTWIWSDPVTYDTSNLRAGFVVLSAWQSTGFEGKFDCFDYRQN